jgi:hypothetical protein
MMKSIGWLFLAIVVFLALPVPAAHAGDEGDQVVLRTKQDMDNYMTGVEFVKELKKKGGTFNLNIVIKGMQDELSGSTVPTTNDGPSVAAPESGSYAAVLEAAPATASAASAQNDHQAMRIPAEASTTVTAAAQGQDGYGYRAVERMRAPNGAILSRTNQARLDVLRMKQELRANGLEGQQ